MKKLIIVLLIFSILILVITIGGSIYTNSIISGIDIEDISLKGIEDGSYYGEYSTTLVSVKVEVVIKSENITDILIKEHECGKGYIAEVIVDDIIEVQSLDVDVISGATMSSQVIKKAVMDAINSN